MKIAIDASRIVNEKAGVGRYSANLIKSLLMVDQKNDYLLISTFFRDQARKKKLMEEYRRPNVEIKYLKIPGKLKEKLWHSNVSFAQKIIKGADVYLAPTFLDVIENLNIPQVVVIHDLTTFKFPTHLGEKLAGYFNHQTVRACKKARKIIAISKNTKKDLLEILKIDPIKIEVIYPGKNEFSEISDKLPAGLKSKSYILTVGTLEPRKNLIGLFKAYALLPPKLSEKYPLVVAGARGWNVAELFDSIELLNLEGKVKFLGFTTDKVLAKLYKEASVFVYPSLYEGFGLPVLEALSFGTPVVTSATSSLPEVAGNAAILVDPTDPEAITSAIQKILEYENEGQRLSFLAKKQAAKFSWKISALEVLKILKSLVR